jgi:hypothetical protein
MSDGFQRFVGRALDNKEFLEAMKKATYEKGREGLKEAAHTRDIDLDPQDLEVLLQGTPGTGGKPIIDIITDTRNQYDRITPSGSWRT